MTVNTTQPHFVYVFICISKMTLRYNLSKIKYDLLSLLNFIQ